MNERCAYCSALVPDVAFWDLSGTGVPMSDCGWLLYLGEFICPEHKLSDLVEGSFLASRIEKELLG